MKYNVKVSIGLQGCREDVLDIPDEELAGMSPAQVDEYVTELAQEWANNYIDVGWEAQP